MAFRAGTGKLILGVDSNGLVSGARRAFDLVVSGAKKAALGIAAATGALTYAFVKTFQSVDELAKASFRLGVPVQKLRELEYIANLAGVSTEELRDELVQMTKTGLSGASAVEKLFSVFSEGTFDLDRTIRRFRDLGGVLDDDTAEKVTAVVAQFKDFGVVLQGLVLSLLPKVSDIIGNINEKLLDWAQNNGQAIRSGLQQFFEHIAGAVVQLDDALSNMVVTASELSVLLGKGRMIFDTNVSSYRSPDELKQIEEQVEAIAELERRIDKLKEREPAAQRLKAINDLIKSIFAERFDPDPDVLPKPKDKKDLEQLRQGAGRINIETSASQAFTRIQESVLNNPVVDKLTEQISVSKQILGAVQRLGVGSPFNRTLVGPVGLPFIGVGS